MQAPSWYHGSVSRETLERLAEYCALLRKWTTKINLISKASEPDLENRHVWDCAQIYEKTDQEWLDMGSGGGLPGVVVAILAQGDECNLSLTMVESDERKATFLRTCSRQLSLSFDVATQRVESMEPQMARFISARAVASLDTLLKLSTPHLKEGGECIFMKGEAWKDEVVAAQRNWRFSCDPSPSKTNPRAAILRIKGIERV